MPDLDLTTVVILLGACVGLLFMILMVTVGFSARLGRIERLLAQKTASKEPEIVNETREPIDTRAGSAFDSFLNQDPARKLLSKKEQSAAYRKWRQDQGMNWSNS